jgi:nucleotide-binding universal stress UspA family protein
VYVPRDKILQSQAEHGRAVLQPAEAILKAAGVPYQAETLTGPIAKVLAERASSLGCESIVMGTHGRDTAGKLLAGSIATKLVHLSELPVTLVK